MDKEKELYFCVNVLQKCKILYVFSPSLWIDLVFLWMALYSIDFHSCGLTFHSSGLTLYFWIDFHSCGLTSIPLDWSPFLWIDLLFLWTDFHSSGLTFYSCGLTSIPLDWLSFLWIDLHSCGFLSYSCGIHWNRPIPAGICGAPKSTELLDWIQCICLSDLGWAKWGRAWLQTQNVNPSQTDLILLATILLNLIGAIALLEHIPVCHWSFDAKSVYSLLSRHVVRKLDVWVGHLDSIQCILFEWFWQNAQCTSQNRLGERGYRIPSQNVNLSQTHLMLLATMLSWWCWMSSLSQTCIFNLDQL